MRTLLIVNDPPYGNERSYNALRLGYYNINRMLRVLTLMNVPVGVCGTCMDARGITKDELVDGASRSTMDELTEWTGWAHKVVVF